MSDPNHPQTATTAEHDPDSLGPPEPDGRSAEEPARPIVSPTLLHLDAEEKHRLPAIATVCEACPNSMWWTSAGPDRLRCFCRVMHLVVWDTDSPSVFKLCDGIYIGAEEEGA